MQDPALVSRVKLSKICCLSIFSHWDFKKKIHEYFHWQDDSGMIILKRDECYHALTWGLFSFSIFQDQVHSIILMKNRLNSEIFRIFELSEGNLYLNNSNCKASKIIEIDTKLEQISWEVNVKNPLFNFCVGIWVGGQENSTSFNTNFVTGNARNDIGFEWKPTPL